MKGFSRSIGFTSSIMVELWAFRDGLRLASQLGIQNLEVEMDAKVIVDLINSNVNYNRAYSPLLHDCRLLLSRFPQVRVAHVSGEANKCVDALAKRGRSLQEDFVVFDTFPSVEISDLLSCDVNGLYYCRLSAATVVLRTS